jgi:predicted HD phosphohydrolase
MSTNSSVSFTAMKHGTATDFGIIAANDEATARQLPDRLVAHLREMDKDDGAYQISRLEHVLQCATRAHRDGADDDWVVAALLHDIGDVLAPFTHGQVAGEILRPFVREEVAWVVANHGTFQMYYNVSLTEALRNSRDKFKDHPWYQQAADFCENWDQCSFDPEYDTMSLEFFVPVLQRVFGRVPFDPPSE